MQKNSILGGGAPRLASLEPKPEILAARGKLRAAQGMSAGELNRKSGRTDEKSKKEGKPAPATRKTAAPALPDRTATEGIYWTYLTAPPSAAIRKAWGLGQERPEWPHSRLCSLQFATAKELMDDARTKGWRPGQYSDPEHCFARVELTADGFNVVRFPSYAAAVADDQAQQRRADSTATAAAIWPANFLTPDEAREALAEHAAEALAEVPDLKPCQFCRQSDRLQVIGCSWERYDGTDAEGDSVRCNRCDCVVPLAAWQGGTEVAR